MTDISLSLSQTLSGWQLIENQAILLWDPQRPALEKRVRLAAADGNRPHVIAGLEHFQHSLDVDHRGGQLFGLGLIIEDFPAQLGVELFEGVGSLGR